MGIGGWAAFHSLFVTTAMLYKVKDKTRVFEETEDDDEEGKLEQQIVNLPLYVRLFLYAKTHSIG